MALYVGVTKPTARPCNASLLLNRAVDSEQVRVLMLRNRLADPQQFDKFLTDACEDVRKVVPPGRRNHASRSPAHRWLIPTLLVCVGLVLAARSWSARSSGSAVSRQAIPPRHPVTQYEAAVPKTIVELQRFRMTNSIRIRSDKGVEGAATLVNLNPTIDAWYLLGVAWKNGSESFYHIENPDPGSQKLGLDSNYPLGIEISEGNSRYDCNFFGGGAVTFLDQARNSRRIYAPICDGRLFLRNPAIGSRTNLEAAAEFFRDQVWGGEKVIVLFHHLLEDSHRETGKVRPERLADIAAEAKDASSAVPLPARINPQFAESLVTPKDLGIPLEAPEPDGVRPGVWYSAGGNPGIYVSLVEPKLIDPAILSNRKEDVNPLDWIEASALCYLVAFDLDRFDISYALGTEHPGVDWSDHIQKGVKDARLPGPDGIGTIWPLVSTGLIGPEDARRTVATFTGGFKRAHGAFKYGEFASRNYGSHYGFLENGVVFSSLQPGLATIFVLDDGSTQMKTWSVQDSETLSKVRYARQNGVPLVEYDDASHSTVPGRLVTNWGSGNWSGSEDMKLRTIRSGAALQVNGNKRFLIYAVFSDATPSAMARVFQAYQCRYGMLMDMNALEHTYLALYRRSGSKLFVDHLITGMAQVEKTNADGPVPRFLGYPDNRDFFYVMRRDR